MSALITCLRMRYRPKRILLLFVAESPPAPTAGEERFFYNAKLESSDFMYRSMMEAVFPRFRFRRGEKNTWLRKFQQRGCFLIDATDHPVNRVSETDRESIILSGRKRTLLKIRKLTAPNTPIVLIKKNIFVLFNRPLLRTEHNVIHTSFLPFPAYGNQKKFVTACRECLRKILTLNAASHRTRESRRRWAPR